MYQTANRMLKSQVSINIYGFCCTVPLGVLILIKILKSTLVMSLCHYVLFCDVISCNVMPCYVMPCYVMLCQDKTCNGALIRGGRRNLGEGSMVEIGCTRLTRVPITKTRLPTRFSVSLCF